MLETLLGLPGVDLVPQIEIVVGKANTDRLRRFEIEFDDEIRVDGPQSRGRSPSTDSDSRIPYADHGP